MIASWPATTRASCPKPAPCESISAGWSKRSFELSKSEQDELNVRLSPEPSLVLGDVYQLGFAVQSILAYFLRSKPADGRVDIEVSGETNEVTVRITGPDSPIEAAPETDVLALAEEQARASIALGESSLKHIIEVNHLSLRCRAMTGSGSVHRLSNSPQPGSIRDRIFGNDVAGTVAAASQARLL